MRLTFLGTGTSFGVPVVGCECPTCSSPDPRDRRGRHGAVVDLPAGRLLVDTPPELRLLLLQAGVRSVDAVWFTHPHADHLHGIDDLRVFSVRRSGALPIHAPAEYAGVIQERFPYIFDENLWLADGSSIPELRMIPFEAEDEVEVLGARLQPLPVPHGRLTAYGFRVGGLGYITDGKALPPDVVAALEGVDTLVLNALWWGEPHSTHFNVEEAVEAARSVGARRTFLTHLTHRVRHQDLLDRLPEGVEPAFDGLVLDIPL